MEAILQQRVAFPQKVAKERKVKRLLDELTKIGLLDDANGLTSSADALCEKQRDVANHPVNNPPMPLNSRANGSLILKRASKHRSGGPRDDDDYDVFDGERNVGRIMLHPQAPKERPWFWTVSRFPQKPTERGYSATREEAMASFKAALFGSNA